MPPTSLPALIAVRATTNTTSTLPPWLQLAEPDPNERNGGSVIPVAVISAAVAAAFVAMRFYTRARILRSVQWEDWTILLSLVFAIATSGGMITQLKFGLGEHLYFVWPTFSLYIQAGIFTNLFYSLSLTLTKVSILLLYIRILTYDLFRLLGKILLAVVLVTHVWIIASILTTCIPLNAAWHFDPASPPLYCHPVPVFWVNACLHIATDFLIFLLPLPVISGMRLPRRQKTGLYFVFCFAFLVCAISTIRLVGFFHTDESPDEVLDITWSAVRIANWTCVEVHAAIVTACLPTLKPLLCALFPGLMAAAGVSSDSPSAFAAAAARRQREWEENFSNGDLEGYQRPLTIGTKSNRPPVRRDTFASLMDLKTPAPQHVEVGTPTSATKLAVGDKDGAAEFRLAEVDAGGPLQWPPSPFRGSRLHLPRLSTLRRDRSFDSIDQHGRPVSGRRIV